MNKPRIYLSSPHMSGHEQKFIQQAFDENWIAPLGPNVDGLEDDIEAYNSIDHCAVLCSGTAAIHIGLILLGVKQEDEVLCSTFTFSATVNAIRYCNAVPVFVDSEKDTWNMCPEMLRAAIEDRIKKGKKPKVCIIVHLYGMPSKMDELMAICEEYEIPVLEDSAEALGAEYKGQKMGTFGELGIYSFNGNKIISTSGGGALVSKNQEHIERAKFLSTQARDKAPHYQHSVIGYNYRMSNIVAGIGRGQMIVLDKWIEKRRNINKWYRELLSSIDYITFLEEPSEDFFSTFWLTCIYFNKNDQGVDREMVRLKLLEQNIESRPLWKPMHMQPVFKDFPAYVNGFSEDLFVNGLCLPSGSNMTEEHFDRIQSSLLGLLSPVTA